jgi:hypothetical protein
MSGTHGAIWWSELMTRNPKAARGYYGALCGWSWDTMKMEDGSDYHVASRGGRPIAGVMDVTGMPGMEGVPAHWFTYIAVDDVDAAARATEERGGKVLRPPWDVSGVGRIAILEDPSGATVGLMTPAAMPG